MVAEPAYGADDIKVKVDVVHEVGRDKQQIAVELFAVDVLDFDHRAGRCDCDAVGGQSHRSEIDLEVEAAAETEYP